MLAQHSDTGAADIGTDIVTDVPEETRIDDLESSSSHEDGTTAIRVLTLGVAVDEGQVLHRQTWMILVLTMGRRPYLRSVARVHVEDAPVPHAAERHESAAVDHDLGPGVVDNLGGGRHLNRQWGWTTIERDSPALGNRCHNRGGGAALRSAVANDVIGMGGVDGLGLDRHRRGAVRVASRWCSKCRRRQHNPHGHKRDSGGETRRTRKNPSNHADFIGWWQSVL